MSSDVSKTFKSAMDQASTAWRVYVIVYSSIVIISALGWLVYFTFIRKGQTVISGVVWARGSGIRLRQHQARTQAQAASILQQQEQPSPRFSSLHRNSIQQGVGILDEKDIPIPGRNINAAGMYSPPPYSATGSHSYSISHNLNQNSFPPTETWSSSSLNSGVTDSTQFPHKLSNSRGLVLQQQSIARQMSLDNGSVFGLVNNEFEEDQPPPYTPSFKKLSD